MYQHALTSIAQLHTAYGSHLLSYELSSWIVGKVNVNAGNLIFDLASNKDSERGGA